MNAATAAMFGSAINTSTARDLYPDAPGASTAQIGSAATPYTTDASSASGGDPANANAGIVAAGPGLLGQPISWFVIILVLFLILGWVGKKVGGREGETGVHNLKLSGYNILFISLAAMIGLGALKVVFSRVRIPGLSTFVQSV
jgi:hypothetical protein